MDGRFHAGRDSFRYALEVDQVAPDRTAVPKRLRELLCDGTVGAYLNAVALPVRNNVSIRCQELHPHARCIGLHNPAVREFLDHRPVPKSCDAYAVGTAQRFRTVRIHGAARPVRKYLQRNARWMFLYLSSVRKLFNRRAVVHPRKLTAVFEDPYSMPFRGCCQDTSIRITLLSRPTGRLDLHTSARITHMPGPVGEYRPLDTVGMHRAHGSAGKPVLPPTIRIYRHPVPGRMPPFLAPVLVHTVPVARGVFCHHPAIRIRCPYASQRVFDSDRTVRRPRFPCVIGKLHHNSPVRIPPPLPPVRKRRPYPAVTVMPFPHATTGIRRILRTEPDAGLNPEMTVRRQVRAFSRPER